jgi:hypothetical protein
MNGESAFWDSNSQSKIVLEFFRIPQRLNQSLPSGTLKLLLSPLMNFHKPNHISYFLEVCPKTKTKAEFQSIFGQHIFVLFIF